MKWSTIRPEPKNEINGQSLIRFVILCSFTFSESFHYRVWHKLSPENTPKDEKRLKRFMNFWMNENSRVGGNSRHEWHFSFNVLPCKT